VPEDELRSPPSARDVAVALKSPYEHRLGKGKDFVLGQEAVLILVMDVEEPLDVVHEVVEHYPIQARNNILDAGQSPPLDFEKFEAAYLEGKRSPVRDIPEGKQPIDKLMFDCRSIHSRLWTWFSFFR
jgi:hypothetical protein